MSIRTVPLAPTEFFHIYNRGTDKRTIYLDTADYERFLELLYICNSTFAVSIRDVRKVYSSIFDFDRGETLVAIGAYCLMPNHFHILLTANSEGGISRYLSKLTTGYSMYFNRRYDRSGALFQGKFKSQHLDSDEYLKYLYAYIHLNPVKLIDKEWKERGSKDAAKSFDFAASYQYSSLPDYLAVVRKENKILDQSPFPSYFNSANHVRSELFNWLTLSREKVPEGNPR